MSLASYDGLLPVGVGFLPFVAKLENVLPVLERYRPAVVWLFATKLQSDFRTWVVKFREASPGSMVWIQIGSVAAALEVAKMCQPDVLCIQGQDAGGHGFQKGAGIVPLLPEVADTLAANGFGNIKLVAAGGISDGRGVASALSLGAAGVVMGTRFLCAQETTIHPKCQAAVLATQDGGQSTIRTTLFDELRGPNMWPELYNGRGIRTNSSADFESGVSMEEIRQLHAKAEKLDGKGFDKEDPRAVIWAGTGVGLVKNVKPAGDIVEEVRDDARKALEEARSRL